MIPGKKKYDFPDTVGSFRKPNPSHLKVGPNTKPQFRQRSLTPNSRIKDRISTSPLKVPLEQAINRAVRDKPDRSPSRVMGHSSRTDENSIIALLKRTQN